MRSPSPTPPLANTVRNDIQAVRTTLEGIAKGATNNNTFKNSVNFYGTYDFRSGPSRASTSAAAATGATSARLATWTRA